MPRVTEVGSKKKEKRGKRRQRSALTGTGGGGGVVGRSTAGIVGLLEMWGMQVRRGMNVVLLSACGCDGMRGGHVIAPTDGWRVKRQEVGVGVKGGKPMCVTGAGSVLLCRKPSQGPRYLELQRAQRKKLRWGDVREVKKIDRNKDMN